MISILWCFTLCKVLSHDFISCSWSLLFSRRGNRLGEIKWWAEGHRLMSWRSRASWGSLYCGRALIKGPLGASSGRFPGLPSEGSSVAQLLSLWDCQTACWLPCFSCYSWETVVLISCKKYCIIFWLCLKLIFKLKNFPIFQRYWNASFGCAAF